MANMANSASNANFTKWICSLCPEREKFSSQCDAVKSTLEDYYERKKKCVRVFDDNRFSKS